ncbi:MAG: signal peptidase I [Ornithinimicrobium sp.]
MTSSSNSTGTTGVGRLRPTRPGGAPTGRLCVRARIRRLVIRIVAVAALAPLWFVLLAPEAIGGPLSMIWVSGTSMEPTLSTGDLAVLYRSDAYEVGDIVAFEIPEGGTVIHRVIEVGPDGYRFQGDNRDFHDPWVLDEAAVLGRQVLSVPQAARAMTTVARPEILAALAAGLVVYWRLRRNDADPDPAAQTPSGMSAA